MSSNSQDTVNNSNQQQQAENADEHNEDDQINLVEVRNPNPDANHPEPENHNNALSDNDDDDDDNNDPNENIQNDVADDEIIFQVSDDDDDDDSYWNEIRDELEGDPEQNSDENPEAESDEAHSPLAPFDPELPIRHSYLGEGMAPLQGRVLLEENTILEIPLIVMGLHLVPGQTLPMTVYHTGFQNAIRRSVVNDRLVGLVSNGIGHIDGRTVVNRGALGTLAEIYEFQEENDTEENVLNMLQGAGGFNFAFKAKGRQRFNVLEVRRQADGNLMGKVQIRPEVVLQPLVMEVLSHGGGKYNLPNLPSPISSPISNDENVNNHLDEGNETMNKSNNDKNEIANAKELNLLSVRNQNRRNMYRRHDVFMQFPAFVYELYDENILVERIHKKLRNDLKGLTESDTSIPFDATELSYWLAQNFIMDDSIRLKILKMDSAIQRLRFELSLLDNVSRVISCRRCQLTIADHSDIFAMSREGPQGTYVNPQGYVHETLTVHKAKDVVYRGLPSTESSWFPGYSWTVVECRGCRQHLGWKFRATGRLIPKKFWGLTRKSVTFKYDFNPESNDPDLLERRPSKTSMHSNMSEITNNNGYQEVGPLALTLPPLLPPYPFSHGR